MAELDVEAVQLVSLKHELAKVAEDPDEFTLHASEIRPLLAALEDRDRLRAVATAAQAWADARFHGRHEAPQIKALLSALAALEGRDD